MAVFAFYGRYSTIVFISLHCFMLRGVPSFVIPLNRIIPKNQYYHLKRRTNHPTILVSSISICTGPFVPHKKHHQQQQQQQKHTRIYSHNSNMKSNMDIENSSLPNKFVSGGNDDNGNAGQIRHHRNYNNNNNNNKSKNNNHNQKKKSTTKKNKVQSSSYRPGFNSYLKVVLDDISLDYLHQSALYFRDYIQQSIATTKQQEGEKVTENSSSSSNTQNTQKNRTKRPPTFKPRSLTSLHMTLFFGGETLCKLPKEELIEWHGRITNRLSKSNFTLLNTVPPPPAAEAVTTTTTITTTKSSSLIPLSTSCQDETNSNDDDDNDYTFTLREFCLFPPRRNNLIVAVFDASSKWYELHDDLRNIALDSSSSSEMLQESTKRTSKQQWTAHITLGNLNYYGNKRKRTKEKEFQQKVQEFLQTYSQQHQHSPQFLTTNMSTSSCGSSPPHTTTTSTKQQVMALTKGDNNSSNNSNDDDGLGSTIRNTGPGKDQHYRDDDDCRNKDTIAQGTSLFQNASTNTTIPLQVEKISMGGPIPKQVELDWDFYYLQKLNQTKSNQATDT